MSYEKKVQAAAQCKAVAHLAQVLSNVHSDYEALMAEATSEGFVEIVGQRTARFMEDLGDMLNAMDCPREDKGAWLDPIFSRAHEMWPSSPPAHTEGQS